MTRGSDNQEEVSSILNLTDGMLGDFLGLQIICTINCRVSDIDQALLRPGRLIAHRKFERLNPAQAARLASQLGKSLPQREDYSLAEVFSGEEQQSTTVRPRMGFGSR
jgi:ATP-dependent 26S proteasome regulatory subunit